MAAIEISNSNTLVQVDGSSRGTIYDLSDVHDKI